ncbi:MAG: TolC family protein [Bacteroidota bacterium]
MRIFLILLVFAGLSVRAQDSVVQDTVLLSLDDILKLTISYHPTVKQAELLALDAEANLRGARGNFDPKLGLDYDLKEFEEKEYFNLLSTTLKVPTNIGLDPKIEFNRNSGEFINDQNEIPADDDFRQLSIGVDLPIGRGLLYDERRNAIVQAEAFSQIAEAEQIKEINKILFTVVKDYWTWFFAHRRQLLLSQAIALAKNLFDRTLLDYTFGESAVVDTLQAKINYQKRIVDYEQALLDFNLARLELSRHLWTKDELPLEIVNTALPDSSTVFPFMQDEDLRSAIDFAMVNHPDLNKLEGKQQQISADIRLAKEFLKPQADLSYSFINAPVNSDLETSSLNFNDNYKLGVNFSIPVFLRKERGKLQQFRLKLRDNELEQVQNQLLVKNRILGSFSETITFNELLVQYSGIANNFKLLLDAEIINLQNGETDLFKLNIQQDKYIESQLDALKSYTELEKSKAKFNFDSGRPFLGLSGLSTNE